MASAGSTHPLGGVVVSVVAPYQLGFMALSSGQQFSALFAVQLIPTAKQ